MKMLVKKIVCDVCGEEFEFPVTNERVLDYGSPPTRITDDSYEDKLMFNVAYKCNNGYTCDDAELRVVRDVKEVQLDICSRKCLADFANEMNDVYKTEVEQVEISQVKKRAIDEAPVCGENAFKSIKSNMPVCLLDSLDLSADTLDTISSNADTTDTDADETEVTLEVASDVSDVSDVADVKD